jgi:flavin reductase (DIM6/NTAB) family NADH-FMN oxidoreductase RutF
MVHSVSANLSEWFEKLTHGVYVIGVADAERRNAFTAAWLMQASFDPPLLALSINPKHSSYRLLQAGGSFTVNVLAHGRTDLAAHFGQPATVDKLAGMGWHPAQRGAPVLEEALAWFECVLTDAHPAGDHVIAIGRVIDGACVSPGATPMNYRETGDLDGAAALLPATLSRP